MGSQPSIPSTLAIVSVSASGERNGRLKKSFHRRCKELNRTRERIRTKHGIPPSQPVLFVLNDPQPASNQLVAETRWNPIKSRLPKIQQVGELVEPNMIAVRHFFEAPRRAEIMADTDLAIARLASGVVRLPRRTPLPETP